MIGILTGDIVSSSKKAPEQWLKGLKSALMHLQPDTRLWEVYRGDSFQMELPDVEDCFIGSIYLKACIKCIKGLDVRIAIGLGSKTYEGSGVSESNGPAFRYSGETIEKLKKDKQNLMIKSENLDFDEQFNLLFRLAMIPMNDWTVNSAEIVKLVIENPDKTQIELAELVNLSQHAVSKRIKRAHLDEILELDNYFRKSVNNIL